MQLKLTIAAFVFGSLASIYPSKGPMAADLDSPRFYPIQNENSQSDVSATRTFVLEDDNFPTNVDRARTKHEFIEVVKEPVRTLEGLAASSEFETIRERHPDGSVKIERTVVQDKNGNYVNHGPWVWMNKVGESVAEGHLKMGKKDGEWKHWLWPDLTPTVASPQFHGFQSPFLSTATFKADLLNGNWKIADSRGRTVVQLFFSDGIRQGETRWFHSNGHPAFSTMYIDGSPEGVVTAWDAQGNVIKENHFLQGRMIVSKNTYHKPATKQRNRNDRLRKSQESYLTGEQVADSLDNWWDTRFATFKTVGTTVKHGEWTLWHPNGNMQQQGRYEDGHPVGEFTYWYSNGQMKCQGSYVDATRNGQWTWWHENGMKKAGGIFQAGVPSGDWQWWNASGIITKTKPQDFEL